MCPRSALSDFTNIVTRIFAVLKKLTCIAFCVVKIHEIFVICLFFSRGQMKCCWLFWELIFYHLRILSYLYTLILVILHITYHKLPSEPLSSAFHDIWGVVTVLTHLLYWDWEQDKEKMNCWHYLARHINHQCAHSHTVGLSAIRDPFLCLTIVVLIFCVSLLLLMCL